MKKFYFIIIYLILIVNLYAVEIEIISDGIENIRIVIPSIFLMLIFNKIINVVIIMAEKMAARLPKIIIPNTIIIIIKN